MSSIILGTLLCSLFALAVLSAFYGTGLDEFGARHLDYISVTELVSTLLLLSAFSLPAALLFSFALRRIFYFLNWNYFGISPHIVLLYVIFQYSSYLFSTPQNAQSYFNATLSDALDDKDMLAQLGSVSCQIFSSRKNKSSLPYVRVFECSVETQCGNQLSYRFFQDAMPDGGLHQYEEPILTNIAQACPVLIVDKHRRDEILEIIRRDSEY